MNWLAIKPIPEDIKSKIGTSVNYSVNKQFKNWGIISDVKWSGSVIVEMKKGKPTGNEFYGIKFLIKPVDQKAFWTKTLCSDILVEKPKEKRA